jgi:hypothetical protein
MKNVEGFKMDNFSEIFHPTLALPLARGGDRYRSAISRE